MEKTAFLIICDIASGINTNRLITDFNTNKYKFSD